MPKSQPTTNVRHPFYDMSGRLFTLQEAVDGDPVMRVDDKLQGILLGIRAEIDSLHAHLDETYLWD